MRTTITFLCIYGIAFSSIVDGARAEWRQYNGIFQYVFEGSGFYECGGQDYWAIHPFDDPAIEIDRFIQKIKLERERAPLPHNELSALPGAAEYIIERVYFYFEVDGFLSPRGNYGHLGMVERQLWIREIYEMREATDADIERCG